MSGDPVEFIVTTASERVAVGFEGLYALRDDMRGLMLLWNTNSYYVTHDDNAVLINGGRRITFPKLGAAKVVYRRRNSLTMSANGAGQPVRKHEYLMGLEGQGAMVLLRIAADGSRWSWANSI